MNPKPIKGVALRLTRNDECDVVLAPSVANSRIATAGFVSVTLTNDYSEGTEIEVRNANGDICLYDSPEPTLRGMTVELALCGVPPHVLELLAGYTILEGAGNADIGVVAPESLVSVKRNSVQLEVWQRNAAADCNGTTDIYVQHVLPKTRKWRVTSPIAIADGAMEVTLTGYAEKNPRWAPAVAAEWPAPQPAAIKAGGPHAMKVTGTLPASLDLDDYLPTAA